MGVDEITATATRLRELHDTHKLSWREIAATGEFGDVSHTTLQDVANGHIPGARIANKMGVRLTPYYTLAFRFHDRVAFDRARRAVDAGGDRTEMLMRMIKETTDD